jgi:uncharacterized protein
MGVIHIFKMCRIKRQTLILSFLFLTIFQTGFSQTAKTESFQFPDQIGSINDYEKLFSENEIKELKGIISKHEKETSNQIVIVSVDTFEPFKTLFQYSLELGNYWGVGQIGKSNGIMIVFGIKMRQIRIQVGYGLEDKLKDEEVKMIIDKVIIPEFKNGNYFNGIKKGLLEIIEEIK